MKKFKLIYSSAISATISVLFVTVITVWSELSKPLKGVLTDFSGHHWVSKGILSMLLYFLFLAIFYFIPKDVDKNSVSKSITMLICATLIGMVVIFLFYVDHYLGIVL